MFWITFYILIVTNIVYFVLGSAEVQPWNEVPSNDDEPRSESRRDTISEISIQEGIEKAQASTRKMSFINGIPIDPNRRRSVFIQRPLIY